MEDVKDDSAAPVDPHLSDSCKKAPKGSPKGAVYVTPTQYLDKEGQPLAPPEDLSEQFAKA